jgi:hypothetical protein
MRSARLPAMRTATTTPKAIIKPYAFKLTGPISSVPDEGLGMAERRDNINASLCLQMPQHHQKLFAYQSLEWPRDNCVPTSRAPLFRRIEQQEHRYLRG